MLFPRTYRRFGDLSTFDADGQVQRAMCCCAQDQQQPRPEAASIQAPRQVPWPFATHRPKPLGSKPEKRGTHFGPGTAGGVSQPRVWQTRRVSIPRLCRGILTRDMEPPPRPLRIPRAAAGISARPGGRKTSPGPGVADLTPPTHSPTYRQRSSAWPHRARRSQDGRGNQAEA